MAFEPTDLTFRTPGPTGAGLGRNLTPGELDNNFFRLAEAIVALQSGTTGAQINGIANINVNGTQMTITLLDGTVLGPFTLPVLKFQWREEWTQVTDYAALDVVKVTGTGIYMVLISHTSDAVAFDQSATDSNGDALYLKLFGSVDANLATLGDVDIDNGGAFPDVANAGDVIIKNGLKYKNTGHPDIADFPLFSFTGFQLDANTKLAPLISESATFSGSFEFDGEELWLSHAGGDRGIVCADMFTTQQGSTYTLTSQTAAQKIFNVPANGQITLDRVTSGRTFLFECEFDLSSMSATSGAFGFALGGTATFDFLKWWSVGNKAALATPTAAQSTMNVNSLANTAIVTATTNTVGWAKIQGILRIASAGQGTIIPMVSLGIAAAAVVGRDSLFRIRAIGNRVVSSSGNWD